MQADRRNWGRYGLLWPQLLHAGGSTAERAGLRPGGLAVLWSCCLGGSLGQPSGKGAESLLAVCPPCALSINRPVRRCSSGIAVAAAIGGDSTLNFADSRTSLAAKWWFRRRRPIHPAGWTCLWFAVPTNLTHPRFATLATSWWHRYWPHGNGHRFRRWAQSFFERACDFIKKVTNAVPDSLSQRLLEFLALGHSAPWLGVDDISCLKTSMGSASVLSTCEVGKGCGRSDKWDTYVAAWYA